MSVNKQGTRVYYAASGTAWVAVAPGVAPSGSFTELTRIVKCDVTPMVIEDFDDAPLSATAPDPEMFLKPGMMTFSKDKVTAETTVLRGFCDGTTLKVWVLLYKDGSADYCTGKLKPSKVSAERGDFKAHIPEDYEIQSTGIVSFLAGA